MTHPIVTTVTLVAAVANGIATSQSLGAAGPLTLNGSLVSGGVATFDAPRRVGITSAGDDSSITWTVVGTGRAPAGTTNQAGPVLTETIAGSHGGTAQTTQDFSTVTSITGNGATASNVTAGTTGTGSGPWVPWDTTANVTNQISVIGQVLSGSPVWQLDITYDDVYGTWLPSNVTWPRPQVWSNLQGKTGTAIDTIVSNPIRASRLTLTAVGSVQLTQQQQGT